MKTEKKISFIIGILVLCVGMHVANYGTAVCVSGEITRMNATGYYVLINAMGSLGMILVLPVAGRLTAILGLRKMIGLGIFIQFLGRLMMIFAGTWVPYAAAYLLQAIGGGCYISSSFVLMGLAVPEQERAKYFGYISIANAIGAIFGPLAASNLYALGGALGRLAYIVNFPITLIGYSLIFGNCPAEKTPGASRNFDFAGLGLSVAGISCLVLWLNLGGKVFAWGSLPSLAMAAAAAISLCLLVFRELRISNPAVPVAMFQNRRLTTALICAMAASAYSACAAAYSTMWIRLNYMSFPGATQLVGTAALPQHITIVVLGFFLGGFVARNFRKRFRPVGIASMVCAMAATGLLYCLKFTGTAAEGNVMTLGPLPVGMLLIWGAVTIGGFTSAASQSTFSAFWQSGTPKEELSAGQALYTFGSTGGSCLFGAAVGVVLGTSEDYSRAFAVGFAFSLVGFIAAIRGFRFNDEM